VDLKRFMMAEASTVNRIFKDYGISAGVIKRGTFGTPSYLAYGVGLGRGVKVSAVLGIRRELGETLSGKRGAPTPVRFRSLPLGLEVPHPSPAPLHWKRARRLIDTHSLLLGRSYGYGQPQDETLSLDEHPHTLIAGTTGSGKSVLLTGALLSLLANTQPRDLQLLTVDLKNETLPAFSPAPHVRTFAGDLASAESMIAWLDGEKMRRIRTGDREPRIVLVIDELAELGRSKVAMAQLESLLSVGRSLRLHVIGATQHPLASVIGSVVKANFSTRLVGMVTDESTARTATGRADSGAEYLPGRGAFLRVCGGTMTRFQAYLYPEGDVPGAVAGAVSKYRSRPVPVQRDVGDPPLNGWDLGSIPVHTEPVPASVPAVPLPYQEPGEREREILRTLYQEKGSKNQALAVAYELGKTPKSLAWLNEALEGAAV